MGGGTVLCGRAMFESGHAMPMGEASRANSLGWGRDGRSRSMGEGGGWRATMQLAGCDWLPGELRHAHSASRSRGHISAERPASIAGSRLSREKKGRVEGEDGAQAETWRSRGHPGPLWTRRAARNELSALAVRAREQAGDVSTAAGARCCV